MEAATTPVHDTRFGVVWDEWVGVGEQRKTIRKEMGYNSETLFRRALAEMWIKDSFDDFVEGWSPEKNLIAEDLDLMAAQGL